jgi:hypothetical protein
VVTRAEPDLSRSRPRPAHATKPGAAARAPRRSRVAARRDWGPPPARRAAGKREADLDAVDGPPRRGRLTVASRTSPSAPRSRSSSNQARSRGGRARTPSATSKANGAAIAASSVRLRASAATSAAAASTAYAPSARPLRGSRRLGGGRPNLVEDLADDVLAARRCTQSSGRRTRRCASAGTATLLTSSGVTKSRPSSAGAAPRELDQGE